MLWRRRSADSARKAGDGVGPLMREDCRRIVERLAVRSMDERFIEICRAVITVVTRWLSGTMIIQLGALTPSLRILVP